MLTFASHITLLTPLAPPRTTRKSTREGDSGRSASKMAVAFLGADVVHCMVPYYLQCYDIILRTHPLSLDLESEKQQRDKEDPKVARF